MCDHNIGDHKSELILGCGSVIIRLFFFNIGPKFQVPCVTPFDAFLVILCVFLVILFAFWSL